MDRLSELRRITGYSNEDLEQLTGYTRQGLNKGLKKIQEPLQAKLRIILSKVIDQKISEETAAYWERMAELQQLKNSLQYDYEAPDGKILKFERG